MSDPIIAIPVAIALLIGNAFFVGAEFSLISARRSSLEPKAQEGSRRAKRTVAAMENLSLMLAGAQLGITLCSLGLGALGEPLIAHLLEGPFHHAGVPDALIHPISFIIALAVMTYLHVVLGEMVPKNLALTNPEKAAMWLAPPMTAVIRVLYPAVMGLNHIANLILRLMRVKPQDEVASTFTRDEVAGFVEESHREGLLSSDEEQLLAGALRFDEDKVRTILLPLSQLVTISPQSTPEHIEALAAETGFSRFPVRNRRGRLTGYIHLKDVLGVSDEANHQPLSSKDIRPLISIRTTDSLRAALTAMQQSGSHLAQVEGHDGTVRGIITLEDVLEELVGEITDYRPA